jgi:homoserine kinase
MRHIRVFAPGSIGNVGPGLDVLGLAVEGPGDVVTAARIAGRRIEVRDSGHPSLSADPARHASALAARAVLRLAGRTGTGIALWLEKGLPLSGGQGGSAASAVAGAVATNLLLGSPLDQLGLLRASLAAESKLAGHHLDNIAPSLVGGLTLIRSMAPIDVVRLTPPRGLLVVLAKPSYELRTKRGRAVLPARVSRAIALHQAAQVAGMVAAAGLDDVRLFGRSIDDRIAEPARIKLLPGFAAAKRAALRAGAYGCSISGSGPTLFAVTGSKTMARRVAVAIEASYRRSGFAADVRVAAPDLRGARVVR